MVETDEELEEDDTEDDETEDEEVALTLLLEEDGDVLTVLDEVVTPVEDDVTDVIVDELVV